MRLNILYSYYDKSTRSCPCDWPLRLTCGAEVVKRQRAGEEAHRNRLDAFILSDAWGRNVPSGGAECSHSVYTVAQSGIYDTIVICSFRLDHIVYSYHILD